MTRTSKQRADLRRYTRLLRGVLAKFDQWPRDHRAWARRDQIERWLDDLEGARIASSENPAAMLRLVEELREWWRRERAFLRNYPVVDIPEHWMRRAPSPLDP